MGLLTINCGNFIGYYGTIELSPQNSVSGTKSSIRNFATRKSMKKWRKEGRPIKNVTLLTKETLPKGSSVLADASPSKDDNVNSGKSVYSAPQNSISIPSRSNVLQACTITSGLIAALGLIIRQVSHVGSMEGLPIPDCFTEVSFGFEMWHLELIIGLVMLISSCRYILLKTWPNFAESSETANTQVGSPLTFLPGSLPRLLLGSPLRVFGGSYPILISAYVSDTGASRKTKSQSTKVLSSLQPYDYLVVAFLPGMSEELLFRGALLPLFGFDWKSVLVVSTLFGILHLGNGRKYSFAVWAIFVGIVYGYATIISSSVVVPMVTHALNNLVGGIVWRCTSKSSK